MPTASALSFAFRTGLRSGLVLVPGDAGFDEARAAWNLALDQQPAAVALPRSAGEVVLVCREARARGLRVAPQATGHGAAALGNLSDAVLIRTDAMRGVQVDAGRRVARVEAGAQWQDVVPMAAMSDLRALHGSAADVGVVGYTLGGGYSVYGRRYGLACEHVTAVDIVLDGQLIHATAATHPEILRAVRGGGAGNLGVVTAMEIELFRMGAVQAGHLWFPAPRGGEVLEAWAAWAPQLPDTVSTNARWLTFPPMPELPEHLRGQRFFLVEATVLGDAADADAVLKPMRALEPFQDTMAPMDPVSMLGLHMDPPAPVPFRGDGCSLAALPAEAAAGIAEAFEATSTLVMLQFCLAGAAQARAGEVLVMSGGAVMAPGMHEAIGADLERVFAALAPYRAARDFANFREAAVAPERLHDAGTLAALREVRAAVDPRGMVLANHAI